MGTLWTKNQAVFSNFFKTSAGNKPIAFLKCICLGLHKSICEFFEVKPMAIATIKSRGSLNVWLLSFPDFSAVFIDCFCSIILPLKKLQSTIDNNKFSEKNFRYLGLFCLYRNFIVTVVNRSCDYCNKLGIMSRVSLNKLQCKLWCDILASSMGVLRLLRSQESGVEVSHCYHWYQGY